MPPPMAPTPMPATIMAWAPPGKLAPRAAAMMKARQRVNHLHLAIRYLPLVLFGWVNQGSCPLIFPQVPGPALKEPGPRRLNYISVSQRVLAPMEWLPMAPPVPMAPMTPEPMTPELMLPGLPEPMLPPMLPFN